MKDLAEAALNAAQVKGASYADVRLDERVQQDVTVKNGQLAAVSDDASEGLGVRVLVDGAWGFAGSARLSTSEVQEVVDRAIRIARASARARSAPVDLRSEEHTSELQSLTNLVCRLLLGKKKPYSRCVRTT